MLWTWLNYDSILIIKTKRINNNKEITVQIGFTIAFIIDNDIFYIVSMDSESSTTYI